ncbi:hypothetical protein HAX54_044558, partial [Datura stramonium]|nr:hypothetical protein [Datura stramonium]
SEEWRPESKRNKSQVHESLVGEGGSFAGDKPGHGVGSGLNVLGKVRVSRSGFSVAVVAARRLVRHRLESPT